MQSLWLCAHSQNKQKNIAWLNFASDKLRELKVIVSKQHEHNISILQDEQLKDSKEGEQFKGED